MRVSGKHNDLENVGPSPRHHTFFEMLGNFSFGDYFKRDAIRYAYQLLTQVYGLPADRLVFTVYKNDDEAYDIWTKDIGVDPRRVARMGPKTNFWQMADTGPCGPTSEIHWDKDPDQGVESIVEQLKDEDDRFLEVWNLVFMQYNRLQADPEHTGQFDDPLPAPGVDTGMGLERIVSIVQGKTANYETDLFMPIIEATQRLTGHSDAVRDSNIVPYRVIADHVRAAVFLIADGVKPGAKGRDSVARLVIRRAARFGSKIGFDRPFLGQVADAVIDTMGTHYTELVERAESIKKAITREEELFRRTLDRGVQELDDMLNALPDGGQLAGAQAFYLKATLGLPIEVTRDIVEERGYTVDMAGFYEAEQAHALVSGGGQAMGKIDTAEHYSSLLADLQAAGALGGSGVEYHPYGDTTLNGLTLVALLNESQRVDSAIAGDRVEVILNRTPFYVESGGQVSDSGLIIGHGWQIQIDDMKRPVSGLIVHVGEVVEGQPVTGALSTASVDVERRSDIIRNHTGTHLLHAALRGRLGTHVQQRGSLVAPDRLRFDFAHDERVAAGDLEAIESEVNEAILTNYAVQSVVKPLDVARAEGAMALFGEKYGELVRTVTVGSGKDRYSYELCGGVHVSETAEIGPFVIVSEGSVSSGVRRVEALTGRGAVAYLRENLNRLAHVAHALNASPHDAAHRASALQDELAAARKEIATLRREIARANFEKALASVERMNGLNLLVTQVADATPDMLREMTDWYRDSLKTGVIVLGSTQEGRPQLMVAVTDDLTRKGLHAGNIVKQAAAVMGGGGGGRPNLAQAGGKDVSRLEDALKTARQLVLDSYSG
jgi:alanyl-tRNA synthetase